MAQFFQSKTQQHPTMAKKPKKKSPSAEPSSTRLSVTVPAADYDGIKKAADSKRISVAWVVHDALHRYLRTEHSR